MPFLPSVQPCAPYLYYPSCEGNALAWSDGFIYAAREGTYVPPAYRGADRDPYGSGPPRDRRRTRAPPERKRSHAAVPLAAATLVVGLALGRYSIVVPALLGVALLFVSVSFLSSRLNPFSIGFYLTVKPSWAAIGVVALVGVLLLAASYAYYVSGFGAIAPGFRHLP